MQISHKIQDLEQLNKRTGNFFQSRDFCDVLKLADLNPCVVTVSERGLNAGLLVYNHPSTPITSKLFSNLIIYYGPILADISDSRALDILLRNLDLVTRKRPAIRLDIRTPFPFAKQLHDVFSKNLYTRYDPGGEYSTIIDLTKDEKILWKDMKRFARKNIKKAIQYDVKISEVVNERDLHSFHRIYVETAERRNFIPYPFSFFNAFRLKLEPKGVAKFFLAWHKEKPIAGILNTFHNGHSVPFIAASLREYWKTRPNHLLIWHSICWSKTDAKAKTFKLYHLPDVKKPRNGIDYYTFKTCFGGTLVRECAFYYKILSPIRFRLLESTGRLLRTRHIGKTFRKYVNVINPFN